MLILVAVTVSYSIKSGLLSKAKEGTTGYTYKEEEDEIGEIRLAYKVDSETGKANGTLKEYLENKLGTKIEAIAEDENGNLIIKYKGSTESHTIAISNDNADIDWLYWEYDYGEVVIVYIGSKDKINLNANTQIKGYNVISYYEIEEDAFLIDMSNIVTAKLESVTGILFWNDSKIYNETNLVIPSSIAEIPTSCFENCTGLTNLVIPNNIAYVGKEAFYGWTASQTIDITGCDTSDWDDSWRSGCNANIVGK